MRIKLDQLAAPRPVPVVDTKDLSTTLLAKVKYKR